MESSSGRFGFGSSPQAELDEVRRATERAHLVYPASPIWVWPVVGISAAVLTWSYALEQPFPGMLVFWAGLAICWWVVFRLTKSRGVFPSYSTMPGPLRREVILAWIQTAILVPVVIGLWRLFGPEVASILAGVAFAAVTYLHQRRYDAVASRLRGDDQPQVR